MVDRLPTDTRLVLPGQSPVWRGIDRVVQSPTIQRARRALMRHMPFPTLASEVRDIAYINWIVPLDRVRALVPPNVELWSTNGRTVLTVLTYRHGHFGLKALGPLRSLFPSPLQSNWRLYVRAINGRAVEEPTVLFVSTMIDSTPYALATRLASDALPLHRPAWFEHAWSGDQQVLNTVIEPGHGSAPDLRVGLRRSEVSPLDDRARSEAWRALFPNPHDALAFLCLQDRSVVPVAGMPGTLAQGVIDLPIDVAGLRTLTVEPGSFHSDALTPWVQDANPWCFHVASVPFKVLGERLITTGGQTVHEGREHGNHRDAS